MLQADRQQQSGTCRWLLWSRRTLSAPPAASLCSCRVVVLTPAQPSSPRPPPPSRPSWTTRGIPRSKSWRTLG